MKKTIIILFIIIIIIKLLTKICSNLDFGQNYVLKDIKNDISKYNYTIGPLPYYGNKYKINEITRFYKFVDILHKLKKVTYTNNNRFSQNKISIKIKFFKNDNKLLFDELITFIDYANKYNIMIGFAAMRRKDRLEELNIYLKILDLGYKNVFITLAAYHSDIDERVDIILKKKGTIRLVKGWYNDGNVKNWNTVSENYYRNARKLIKSNTFHLLASHDFIILKKLYDEFGNIYIDKIEIIFFNFSKNYVKKEMKKFPYKIKNISFYKPYGRICLSIMYTLINMDIWRDFQRRYIGRVK